MYKPGGRRGRGRGGAATAAKRPPVPRSRARGGSVAAPPLVRGGASPAPQPAGHDEAFRLESGARPDFAAIIRLTPDLIDEIRRAEAAGGGARIRFNQYNSSENIIDVGGKEFKFTWASEHGDLCDIYEECQSGEDGNGLLVECGSAWRKVNVQRVLDESAKNLVKMRSEEAERLAKSRKAIVLDPANPSVKSQASAAVEGNMWRMNWKEKKESFKKRKAAVIAPTKSVSKVKLSKNVPKGNFLPSPSPEKPGSSFPSFPVGTDENNEVITPPNLNKGENSKVEKEIPGRVYQGINRRACVLSASSNDNTTDMQSLLISILSENPKGMSLKALEKAVGYSIPNTSKKMETIIKNIATFQAPGRYVLKPGLEAEGSKAQASDGGRVIDENIEKAAPSSKIDDSDLYERVEIGDSPSSFAGDVQVNNDTDVKAGSSSDSDSSNSGSDSGSSNDSDSDVSSSSKEGSDAFVDITSDDNKENTAQRKVADDLKLSPRDLTTMDDDDEQIVIGTNMEHKNESAHRDLSNFYDWNDEAAHIPASTENFSASNLVEPSKISASQNLMSINIGTGRVDGRHPENEMPYQENCFDVHLTHGDERLLIEETGQYVNQHVMKRKSTSKDGLSHSPSKIRGKDAKPKLKRPSGAVNSGEKPESAKRAKAGIVSSGAADFSFSEHGKNLPPDQDSNYRLNKETEYPDRDEHMDLHAEDSSPAINGRPVAFENLQNLSRSLNIPVPTSHLEKRKQKTDKSSGKKRTSEEQKSLNGMDSNFKRDYACSEGLPVNFGHSDFCASRKRSRHGEHSVDDQMRKHLKDVNSNVNSINLTRSATGNVGSEKVMPYPESYEINGQPSKSRPNNVEKSSLGGKSNLQPNEERSGNNFMAENEDSRKRRDSSLDEDNLFCSKYNKDEPELKGPIKDFSQFKDYVQEYSEKYKAYCRLNSQLKKTEDKFLKVEHELNNAKRRDMRQYYSMLQKLRYMYHEFGARHKLMKKVFLLLHEELNIIKQRTNDFADGYAKL